MVFATNLGAAMAVPSFVDSVINGDTWNILDDVTISDRSLIDVYKINFVESAYMENRGAISGDIFMCDDCSVVLRNSGSVTGQVHVGDNAKFVQQISTYDDMTKLNVSGSNFSIHVHNKESLNLTDIINIAGNANRIVLDNSFISLTNRPNIQMFGLLSGPDIELVGTVVINLDDIESFNGKLIMSNVYGDGVIRVVADKLDLLYVADALIDNGRVYLNVVRETNYQKLFGTDIGKFINKLRTKSPDNSTVMALDNAQTLSELNHTVKKSVALNPINLMHAVKTFNGFEINSFDKPMSGFDAMYIYSDGLDMIIGKFALGTKIDKFTIGAGAYFGALENTDDINEFSGNLYGGNLRGRYDDKSLWIDARLGFTVSEFETDMIFDGKDITTNPTGVSIYGVTDIGVRYEICNDFYALPFIGMGVENDKVLHQSDTSVFIRAGGVAGYSNTVIGIKNDYQIFATAQTDSVFTVGARLKFFSIADDAGGNVSYAINRDDIGISHKISAGFCFNF